MREIGTTPEPDTPITPEQKLQIAIEAIRGVKTVREIASEYGVNPAQVVRSEKELLENGAKAFAPKRGGKAADPREAVIQKLNKTIEKRRREIAWLKSAFEEAGIEVKPERGKKQA